MRSRILVAVVSVAVGAVTAWAFSNAFVSAEAAECRRLYAAARTAADTAAVEATIPKGREGSTDKRSCSTRRYNARWFTIR